MPTKITDFTEESAREIIQQGREILTAEQAERYKALAIFTDGLPWNPERYIRETRKSLEAHFFSAIDAGKRLIVLHEMMKDQQGAFVSALSQIGIEKRTAYRFMAIAERFAGFDGELSKQLGITKLYSLLKAPDEEIQRLETEGKFLDMDKEQLIAISTRELERQIKDVTDKLREDVKEKDARLEVLHNEIKNQKRELDKLTKQLAAKERGEEGLPSWWPQYAAAIIAMETLVEALKKDPPDVQDKKIAKSFEIPLLRIERAVAGIIGKLRWFPHDEEARVIETQKKLAEITTDDGEFDMDRILKKGEK